MLICFGKGDVNMLTSWLRDAENRGPVRAWAVQALICALLVAVAAAGCGGPPPPRKKPPVKKKIKKPKPVRIKKAPENLPPVACKAHEDALAKAFAPYADAFSNLGLETSPDGKRLLFLSNRGGGSYQLYVADAGKPKSRPVIIAEGKDSVSGARFTPDGKYIVFIRDRDRNENTQIFRATPDGAEVKALTKTRRPIIACPRSRRMARR